MGNLTSSPFPTLTSHTLPHTLTPPPPLILTQTLEEPPGDDCTRFDTVVPTIVKPPPTPLQYTPPPPGLKEEEEGEEELELGILRQFTFSSELQVLISVRQHTLYMHVTDVCYCNVLTGIERGSLPLLSTVVAQL